MTYKIIRGADDMALAFEGGNVTLTMSDDRIAKWSAEDCVGFNENKVMDGKDMIIIAEKDFQCLKPRPHEDESDLYANPLADEE